MKQELCNYLSETCNFNADESEMDSIIRIVNDMNKVQGKLLLTPVNLKEPGQDNIFQEGDKVLGTIIDRYGDTKHFTTMFGTITRDGRSPMFMSDKDDTFTVIIRVFKKIWKID